MIKLKTYIKAFSILLLSIIFSFFLVKADVYSATGYCCPPYDDEDNLVELTGILINGCCYNNTTDFTSNCCSLKDSAGSKCSGDIIPCTNCVDEDPPCEECSLGSCPAPLTDTGDPSLKLANYRSCQNGEYCDDDWKYGDCYENKPGPDPDPNPIVTVLPNGQASTLGCTSSTYSSTNVNSSIPMKVTYTDSDGGSDIEAIYVWYKIDSVVPNTPQYIDLNSDSGQIAKTYTNDSFGFMMHKEGSNWIPYIPSLVGGGSDIWVKANVSGNSFDIYGPSSSAMIRVENTSVSISGNNVILNFNANFGTSSVKEGMYNIFVMANDVFGFTPYDNYGPGVTKIGDYFDQEEIRYYNVWTDSNKDWGYDKTPPSVTTPDIEVTGPTKIKISWNTTDTNIITSIVGNIYISNGVETTDQIREVVLNNPGVPTVVSPYDLLEQGNNLVGNLSSGYIAKATGISSNSVNGNIEMNLGSNREGSTVFYLTSFDIACNPWNNSSLYNLEDWIITNGGFVYSSTGIDFKVKDVSDPNLWTPISLLNKISPTRADISTELFGDALGGPRALDKNSTNKSYSVSPFTGYKVYDFYKDVKSAFERREVGISNISRWNTASLVGTLPGDTSKIYVLDRNGDLTVGDTNPFVCNGKGIFFVKGNLIINNSILNGSNPSYDACIFVVSGDLTINPGRNSSGGTIGYDEINGYFLVNGSVNIAQDSSYDGLYVSGGIQSLGSFNIDRYLGLAYRDTHPLLVVNHHSKYGFLSSILVGNPIDMVKVEVGFKPF